MLEGSADGGMRAVKVSIEILIVLLARIIDSEKYSTIILRHFPSDDNSV